MKFKAESPEEVVEEREETSKARPLHRSAGVASLNQSLLAREVNAPVKSDVDGSAIDFVRLYGGYQSNLQGVEDVFIKELLWEWVDGEGIGS